MSLFILSVSPLSIYLYPYLSLSTYLSLSLSILTSLSLYVRSLSYSCCLSLLLSEQLFIHPRIHLSIHPSAFFYINLSTSLSIYCLSVCLSFSLPFYLSVLLNGCPHLIFPSSSLFPSHSTSLTLTTGAFIPFSFSFYELNPYYYCLYSLLILILRAEPLLLVPLFPSHSHSTSLTLTTGAFIPF